MRIKRNKIKKREKKKKAARKMTITALFLPVLGYKNYIILQKKFNTIYNKKNKK